MWAGLGWWHLHGNIESTHPGFQPNSCQNNLFNLVLLCESLSPSFGIRASNWCGVTFPSIQRSILRQINSPSKNARFIYLAVKHETCVMKCYVWFYTPTDWLLTNWLTAHRKRHHFGTYRTLNYLIMKKRKPRETIGQLKTSWPTILRKNVQVINHLGIISSKIYN